MGNCVDCKIMMMIYWIWQQRLDYNAYMHTYSKGKLGLYIKYIHTVKSAGGAGNSKVNTV